MQVQHQDTPPLDKTTSSLIEMTVADIHYRVSTKNPRLDLAFTEGLKPFSHSGTHRKSGHASQQSAKRFDIQLGVDSADLSLFALDKQAAPLFDTGGLWHVNELDDVYEFIFVSPWYGKTPYRVARIHHDYQQGEVLLHKPYLAEKKPINPIEYPLDEVLLVHLLARHGAGVELHGCGLVNEDGRTALFLGQSGAGKTTMATLWTGALPNARVLSDDRIIIRPVNDNLWMFGTPWHGEGRFALPEKAPLSKIYFLKQAPQHAVRVLSQAESVARLFAFSFIPNYLRDGLESSIQFLAKLTEQIECVELSFARDPSVVDFVLGL